MKIVMIDSLVGNDYTFWLCQGLAQEKQEVELITTKNWIDRSNDAPFLIVPKSPAKGDSGNKVIKLLEYIYYLVWLLFYVVRSQADIIHYQFFRRERIECLFFPILRLFVRDLFFTAHNILPHEYTRLDYYLRYIVYKSATKIIVHTAGVKDDMLKMYKLTPEKIHVVPAVLPIVEHHEENLTKSIAREKLNLSGDDQILLFFGYIRDYKGLDILLDAFELIKPAFSNLKLLIAGKPHTDELHQQYEEQIHRMTSKDSVIFVPQFIPTEDVDYYFSASDAVAMPYKKIYMSGVLQVAFSYGRAVLATNVGNFKENIRQGENGFITNKNTPEEFANIISLAFQDVEKLSEMGDRAYQIHKEYPDWVEIGQMTLEVYNNKH